MADHPGQKPLIERPAHVYFIQDSSNGLIKIGFAYQHPERRRRALECEERTPLIGLGYMPGGWWQEQSLHAIFADLREYGEWFRPGPDLLAYIARYAPGWEMPEAKPPRPVDVHQRAFAARLQRARKHVHAFGTPTEAEMDSMKPGDREAMEIAICLEKASAAIKIEIARMAKLFVQSRLFRES